MSREPERLQRPRTIFDGWRSVAVSLYMALVGYGVLVGIPVISTAWVRLLGFTEVEVGRVAGADLGGLSAGAVLVSFVIARYDRRWLAALGIGLAVLANALCTVFVEYDAVLWLRVLAGIGSGIYTAIAVATLGGSSRPARAFNMLLFAFAFSQALEMQVLPQLSMNGIYGIFIVAYLATLPFLHWIPPRPVPESAFVEVEPRESGGPGLPRPPLSPAVPWLCLGPIHHGSGSSAEEYISPQHRSLSELFRRVFVFLVFEQSTNEFGARIVVLEVFIVLVDGRLRQQHLRLDVGERSRHHEIFAGQVDIEILHQHDVFDVLLADEGDGDVLDVELVLLNEVEQQIEGPLKGRNGDMVRSRHRFGRGLTLLSRVPGRVCAKRSG
jgi:MFS family permease